MPIDPAPSRGFAARLRAEWDRLTAATPAMLHSIDETGRLVSVSDAWLEKLGYRREEVLGRLAADFLIGESRERALNVVLPDLLRFGRCENVQYQLVKKDGGVIDVLVSAIFCDDPFGTGRLSQSVVTDVSDLFEAQRSLAESEAKYRSLVEDQSEMVSLASPEGELRFVNHAYAALHGRSPDQMVGRNLLDFVADEQRAVVADHLKRTCASSKQIEVENEVVLPNGERRWFVWTNRALTDGAGSVTAIHSVGRDIHQRVVAESRLQESEARYRFLAEHSSDMILLVDPDGKRLYASPSCRNLLGYEPEEAIAIRLQEAIHPDDAEAVLGLLATRPENSMLTYRMRRKDGRYIWVETTGKTVDLGDNRRQRLVIVRDVEKRIAAEERLRASEAQYRLLAENSTDMVYQLDQNLVRRYVSPACREILGFAPEEMVGENPLSAAHPEDAPHLAMALASVLRAETPKCSIVTRKRHRNGHWVWVETNIRGVTATDGGKPIGIIGTVRDISARKLIEEELAQANRRLQALAGQDALTGLANRRTFDAALAREFERATRAESSLALIMIDVDRFKAFNDLYGHIRGDDCLKRIAETISRAARRPGDVAARYGGEEFAIILPETDEAGALAIAVRIQQAVHQLKIAHSGDEKGAVSISAGAAAARPAASQEPHALLGEADRALYQAKKGGRSRVVLASNSQITVSSTPPAAVEEGPSFAATA